MRLEGYDDRDKAAELIGTEIGAQRSAMPEPEEGHFYWSDLAGLQVVRLDGAVLGKVREMLETGAHDVMIVDGEQERLIPFVMDEVIVKVDLDENRIDVDWEWD